jgi:hypothetical protein
VKRQLYLFFPDIWNDFSLGIADRNPAYFGCAGREDCGSPGKQYFVRPDKARLALETAINEDRVLESIPEESFCMYIGIPSAEAAAPTVRSSARMPQDILLFCRNIRTLLYVKWMRNLRNIVPILLPLHWRGDTDGL